MPKLKIEYALSGHSKCTATSCKKTIAKHELRIGTEYVVPGILTGKPSEALDGDEEKDPTTAFRWRHLCCFTDRQIQNARTSGDLAAIEGYELLAPKDKQVVEDMKAGKLVNKTEYMGRVGDVANSPMADELIKPKKRAPAKRKAADNDDDNDTDNPNKKKTKAAPTSPAAKRAKKETVAKDNDKDDVDSEATEEYEVAVEAVPARPPCPFGPDCFRTNEEHFLQYDHSNSGSKNEGTAEEKKDTVLRPVIKGKK